MPAGDSSTFKKNDIVILVTGLVGAGRSTFINELFRTSAMQVGDPGSMLACTTEVQSVTITRDHDGRRLVIVDTPGFNQEDKTDSEVLQQISRWLLTSFPSGFSHAGVIYLYDISDDGGHRVPHALSILDACFGERRKEFCPRILLTTTKWTKLTEAKVGHQRQKDLESRHWRLLISGGAKVLHFRDPSGSQSHNEALSFIDDFVESLENEPQPLDITKERAHLLTLTIPRDSRSKWRKLLRSNVLVRIHGMFSRRRSGRQHA